MPAFADDVAGDWLFDTSKFADNDCQISGRITFTPDAGEEHLHLRVRERADLRQAQRQPLHQVQQICTAQRIGKQVAIKSKVDKVLERRPDDSVPAKTTISPTTSSFSSPPTRAEMNGSHYDEQRQLKARFWRDVELIG